jgi:hypothetical protein
MFPGMEEQFTPRYLNLVTAHLDSCKDVCDHFGITTTIVPHVEQGNVKGFTVKSYRNPDKDPDNLEFDYDPFWDDGSDWSHEGVDDVDLPEDNLPEIVNKIPDDDEEIIETTKTWVSKMMSDMGLCPFTKGGEEAGLPIGPVYYAVDRTTSIEEMYARYWQEVVRVEDQPEKALSTTLLIAPEFCIDNVELFESFGGTLTQTLTALGVETLLQLIFFHPHWVFRDGGERGGTGAAANYARRSPWPMINILRTKQVRAAQKGIPTGLVYKQNEQTLGQIGTEKLETMLRLRDWTDIAHEKVDRRAMEALRIAQDYQQTGELKPEDTSLAHDSTPAASKVDKKQIEKGNLINVICQALEKRLGRSGGSVTRLSGPETSATIMASDFLLQELDTIVESGARSQSVDSRSVDPAHQAIFDDFAGPTQRSDIGAENGDILFGRGGLMDGKPVDEDDISHSAGMDPNSFY